MTLVAIGTLYVTSVMLVLCPLVHILLRRGLSRYFVYFVATSSFLALNLLGSVLPRVLGPEPALDLHLAHSAIALALFLLYFAVDMLAPRGGAVAVALRLGGSARQHRRTLGFYVGFLFFAGLSGTLAFYLTQSSPLLFQFEIFGRWGALISRRMAIQLSRPFHWYGLAMFDIPLFIVILLNVLKRTPAPGQAKWRLVFWPVVALSLMASVLLLHKQHVLYLLASLPLVLMVFRNRLPVRLLTAFAVGGAAVGALLYFAFTGTRRIEEIPRLLPHRIFEVLPWGSAVAFELFPAGVPFLEGSSFINPLEVFEFEQVNTATLIHPRVYSAGRSPSWASVPLPAIIEMYVNYGWPGIGLGIVVAVGFIFVATLLSWSRDVWTFALSIYLAMKTLLLWQHPFWFGALEPTLIVLLVLLVISFRAAKALMVKASNP